MIEINTSGATRTVFLTKRWAIKLPGAWAHAGRRWGSFLTGLLANMQERQFSALGWPELCPVAAALPGGFLVVMPRATPLDRDTWFAFDFDSFVRRDGAVLPAERKMDSFGVLNGRIVAVDYGSAGSVTDTQPQDVGADA